MSEYTGQDRMLANPLLSQRAILSFLYIEMFQRPKTLTPTCFAGRLDEKRTGGSYGIRFNRNHHYPLYYCKRN